MNAPSDKEEGSACLVDGLGRPFYLPFVPPVHGIITAYGYFFGVVLFSFGQEDVFRNINHDRSGSAGSGDKKGLLENLQRSRAGEQGPLRYHEQTTRNHRVGIGAGPLPGARREKGPGIAPGAFRFSA